MAEIEEWVCVFGTQAKKRMRSVAEMKTSQTQPHPPENPEIETAVGVLDTGMGL